MQIIIKKLQPPEEYNIAVEPSTKIIEIKRNLALLCQLKISRQKLLYMGRALLDDQTVSAYPNIKDGAKIHLIEIKPEGLESAARYFKEKGMPDEKANRLGTLLQEVAQAKLDLLSWDDIERLAMDILTYEYSDLVEPIDTDSDGENYDEI